jgi:hypothetical protein
MIWRIALALFVEGTYLPVGSSALLDEAGRLSFEICYLETEFWQRGAYLFWLMHGHTRLL